MIDDDMEDFLIISEGLPSMETGEVLKYASGGLDALRQLQDQFDHDHSTPELIVLDLNMPLMDGTETLRAIRNDIRFKDIPVVIYSTSVNPHIEKGCRELGVVACITKPGTLDEITAVGRQLIDLCEQCSIRH